MATLCFERIFSIVFFKPADIGSIFKIYQVVPDVLLEKCLDFPVSRNI